jgi:allantoin racemase
MNDEYITASGSWLPQGGAEGAQAAPTSWEFDVNLLVVNGNRTEAVTRTVLAEVERTASQGTKVQAVTASFGADIVFSHAGDAIAAHAVLDSLARHHPRFDAAILAISFDSGLAAARELLPIPVFGITESALLAASHIGQRIGVITFGQVSLALYREVFHRSGMMPRIAAIRTIEIGASRDYLNAGDRDERVIKEANDLAITDAVDVVVVCGAAVAGIAHRLQTAVRVPIIDGVACAVADAEAAARGSGSRPAKHTGPFSRMAGVSPELAALFEPR